MCKLIQYYGRIENTRSPQVAYSKIWNRIADFPRRKIAQMAFISLRLKTFTTAVRGYIEQNLLLVYMSCECFERNESLCIKLYIL